MWIIYVFSLGADWPWGRGAHHRGLKVAWLSPVYFDFLLTMIQKRILSLIFLVNYSVISWQYSIT